VELGKRFGFSKLREVLRKGPVRFAVVFAIIVALIFWINSLVEPTRFMKRYIEILAASVALVLRMSPFNVVLKGSLIEFHTFAVRIIPECSGVEAMAIFCGAVIAFPATVRKKLLGIGFGVPALYIVNVLRLACLAFIGAFMSGGVFKFVHVYVWQTVFIIFVLILWLIWIEIVVKQREPEQGNKADDSHVEQDDVPK